MMVKCRVEVIGFASAGTSRGEVMECVWLRMTRKQNMVTAGDMFEMVNRACSKAQMVH